MMSLWMAIALGAGLFCLARGAVDLWQRRYVWGGVGVVIGLAILLTPFQTQAVKFDVSPPITR
jgi:hypothetical protein